MSRSEAAALLRLAESIADGSDVDWESAQSAASDDERKVIRQLQILSSLAGLHRSLPAEPTGGLASLARRASAAPAIGTWAHLSLVERLGGGTFGEVYRAWDRHLEREVALKLLRADESADDLHASRIANEGRLLARVRHPNVITVHGVDSHDRRVGLSMELVRGVTLEQQLTASGPLSAREAALIGIDLCRALAAIHAAGLIHRDVKAQNVMREDGGRIVLMDLGTGREAARPGPRAIPELAGTPLYLAPEIFLGAAASARTDLYSLGVLLYRLVTGSFPVRAATFDDLRAAHARGAGIRLRDARADLPTAFVRVVDRATASDPAARYESAGALEADLLATLDESSRSFAGVQPADGHRALKPAIVVAAAAAVVILAVAVPAVRNRMSPRAVPTGKDGILVADFANRTGEAVFDGTLKEALTVELQQSPYFNAIEAQLEGLPAAKSGAGPAPVVSAARELCQHQHLKAIVLGTISSIDSRYLLKVQAQDCATGQPLADGEAEAASKTTVLHALGVATAGLRAKLGEPRASIQQFNVAVEEATTASLDALKAYSGGMDARARLGDAEAIPFFHHALELDPKFALAEAKLASIYANLHEFRQSQTHTKRAFDLSEHVTERERLYIRGSYHMHVTGNLDEAVGAYRLWIQLYPQEWLAHSNLGALYGRVGRFEEAIVELNKGRALGPDQLIPYVQLAETYSAMGRFDEAKAAVEAARARGLDSAATRAMMLSFALIEGGADAMRQEFAAPVNSAKDYLVVAAAARAEAFGGDFLAARSLTAQAVAKAKAGRIEDLAASLIAADALNAAAVNDGEYARTTADRALTSGRGSDTLWAASLANALAGRRAVAEQLTQEYLSVTPPTTDVVAVFGPILQGAAAISRGDAKAALEALQPALPYERLGRFWPSYIRGLAYLRLKQPRDAASQFQTILSHRGDDPTSVLFPLASLQMARAMTAVGDVKGARDSFDAFINRWQQATGNQPLLAAAIRERARLPQ